MMIKTEKIDDDDGDNQSTVRKDQVGADPGNTSRKILLLVEEEMQEDEVMEIAQDPDLEPLPKRKKALQLTQKVSQCTLCSYSSISAGNLTNHLKAHGRNLEHKCSRCDFSSSKKFIVDNHLRNQHSLLFHPSSQVDRAEDILPVNVTEKLDQPVDVEKPSTDVTSVLDKQQSKELCHQKVLDDNPTDSRNYKDDVIYCRRCGFWSRRPEHFHQHLFQCWNGFSCSACDFSGTRLDIIHHIRERIKDGDDAHSTSALCVCSSFTMPDNKYADFRQNIGVTRMQYGFVNSKIREAPPDQNAEDSVWDPLALLSFNQNEGNLENGALNYEKEKDGLKIKIEDSFQQIGELEKRLEAKNIEYNMTEKRVVELKDNASNIDQKKAMKLYENQRLVTQKLNDAVVLKHQAEMAHLKQYEYVKILLVQQVKSSYSKEAGKSLEEAERELERLKQEVEQEKNYWSTILKECEGLSCQLNEAEKTRADNIDFLFFLINSLGELKSSIGNLKGQIAALKLSIQKLLQSRCDLNEAQLKNLSNEFRRNEAEWIQGLHRQFCS